MEEACCFYRCVSVIVRLCNHVDLFYPTLELLEVMVILENGSALVTTYNYNGSRDGVLVKAKPNKGYKELLKLIIESKEKYMPRVVIRGYNVRGGGLYVNGEIYVTIDYNFYLKHATRYENPKGSLIGGVDVNTNRINLVIVDEKGNLRDYKTF
jgi:hypothetical protein